MLIFNEVEMNDRGLLIASLQLDGFEALSWNAAYQVLRFGSKAGMGLTPKAKKYKKGISDSAISQLIESGFGEPYEGDVIAIGDFTFGTKRKKDIQNTGKVELDSLNGIVYTDDSQIKTWITTKHYSKNNPSISLRFYKVGLDGISY